MGAKNIHDIVIHVYVIIANDFQRASIVVVLEVLELAY